MDKLLVYLQSRLTVTAVLEIIIIAFCIYKILMWIQGTQAEQVAKGVLVLLVLMPLSNWLGFTTLNYLFNNMITWLIIIIVVVFQPEMRSALENLGTSHIFFGFFSKKHNQSEIEKSIHQVLLAVQNLSRERIGVLIVCENQTGLKDIVETGVTLNAAISAELLENIFTPNRPLHDGAVVINLGTGKILGAGCLLPLTDKSSLDTELGTRHRAGIGISEQSDALTIIVSEETGTISYTERGQLNRDLQSGQLESVLLEHFGKCDSEEDDIGGSKTLKRAFHSKSNRQEEKQ